MKIIKYSKLHNYWTQLENRNKKINKNWNRIGIYKDYSSLVLIYTPPEMRMEPWRMKIDRGSCPIISYENRTERVCTSIKE